MTERASVNGIVTEKATVELDGGQTSHEHGASEATASRRAARYLRDQILGGAFPPGSRIQQEAVAKQLAMSRIPVREALRQLETEGLVVLVAHGSARVPKLNFEEYTEIYRIREYLEPLAAAEGALRISAAELEHLRLLVREMDDADQDSGAWLDLDRRFHLASYAPARMPRLQRTVESFWNTTQPYRRAFVSTLTPQEAAVTRAEHALLLDAFARHDSTDAEQLVRSHIRRTRLRLASHRELFTE